MHGANHCLCYSVLHPCDKWRVRGKKERLGWESEVLAGATER